MLGTSLLARGADAPYITGGAIAALFVPVALWLRRSISKESEVRAV